jgi:hypothetical protein
MQYILTDKVKRQKAIVQPTRITDNLVEGTLLSYDFHDDLLQKIKEFESLVNDFVFGNPLEEVGKQLDAYNWKVQDKNWQIYDVQIFGGKNISFRFKAIKPSTAMDIPSLEKKVNELKNNGFSFLACVAFVQKDQGISLKEAKDLTLTLNAYNDNEKNQIQGSINLMLSEFEEE